MSASRDMTSDDLREPGERELAERLERLATWPEPDEAGGVAPWRAALEEEDRRASRRWFAQLPSRRVLTGVAALVITVLSVGTVALLRIGGPRETERQRMASPDALASVAAEAEAGIDESSLGGRWIAHKVTIRLRTQDVRSAFLMAQRLASVARGEFIERSTLAGEGAGLHGSLVLRVRTERLDETLNALRDLGAVVSEERTSEDVTTQVIDVEARLRNERRIEEELLALLEARSEGAKLEEVFTLRDRLSQVRGVIERLEGQRAATERLTALASILVIITADRPEATEEGQVPSGTFGAVLREGWNEGVRTLGLSCAALLRLLIGALPWWLIGAGVLLLIVRARAGRHLPERG